MASGRKQFTFFWSIENVSYCVNKKDEGLFSPRFTADGLEATAWNLGLHPRGWGDEYRGFISLYLVRSAADDKPEQSSVKSELSILAEDGSVISSQENDDSFESYQARGKGKFLKMDKLLFQRNFPRDVLAVRCKIWNGEGEVHEVAPICARTRIGVETVSFTNVVHNFSTLLPDQKQCIQIPSPLKREGFVTSSLYFTHDSSPAGEMMVEIMSSDGSHVLCKRKIYLLERFGNEILCAQDDNRFDISENDIQKLPLSLTRQEILSRKSKYLPDDKLSLRYECSFSTGLELNQIEESQVEMSLAKQSDDQEPNKKDGNSLEKASQYSSVSEDIKAIYINKSFTDVEVKTKSKSFRAHKLVLCARSSVFQRMLKERNTDCIEVDDLRDDVVQQLLLFLYSDTVQNLEWAMATRLYYAGDKYGVGRLKAVCCSFLVEHLTPATAGELLLLADTHGDDDLKKVVEDFILDHERAVFGSKEWETLIETNPVLAMKAMHLKYKK